MIKGCHGYRLLCQIDDIFYSLNAELTAVIVYPEELTHPLDPGQKPKPVLVLYRICVIARADRASVNILLKGSTGERSG